MPMSETERSLRARVLSARNHARALAQKHRATNGFNLGLFNDWVEAIEVEQDLQNKLLALELERTYREENT